MTTNLHFLFVALTLGLVPLVALAQTWFVITARERFDLMTRFWGQVYLVNYAPGSMTGLVLEFQFGMNWSGLSHFAGDVFGAPLAVEAMTAFFLESTFLGLWIFGWRLLTWSGGLPGRGRSFFDLWRGGGLPAWGFSPGHRPQR